MLTAFNDPTTPECLKKLSEDQKKKIIKITIDQMDFSSMLAGAETPFDQDKLQAAIVADKDLGPDVGKCVA